MKNIFSIQALRGLAAAMVAMVHAQGLVGAYQPKHGIGPAWINAMDPQLCGQAGVDIFFVISGFVMALVTFRAHRQAGAPWAFLKKRIVRIFPAYWLWTLVMAGLLAFFPVLFQDRVFSLPELGLSLALLPYIPLPHNNSPVLPVGWTLSYEMYFYGLVAVGLWLPRLLFLIGLGCFFVVTTLMVPWPQPSAVSVLISSPLLWEFYAGLLLGDFYARGGRLPLWLCGLCVAAAVAYVVLLLGALEGWNRFMYWGLPALLLVTGVVFGEQASQWQVPRWMVALGDSSYSFYLSHLLVMPAIGKVLAVTGLMRLVPPDVLILLMLGGSVLAGWLLYLTTEMPMLRLLRGKLLK